MEYTKIVEVLAPCGLNCGRCAEYQNGEIKQTSEKLISLLGNYQRMASIKEKIIPAFASFPQFTEILNSFAQGICGGCRSNENYCPVNCAARTCHREKDVDFCFQCDEFPCSKQVPPGERWIEMNKRMKEIGVEQFFEEQSKLPRY